MSQVLCLWLWGIRLDRHGQIAWSWRRRTVVESVVFAPALVGVAVAIWRPPPDDLALPYVGWLLYFLFINALAFLLPRACVACFYDLTPYLDRMLTPAGRRAYDEWADSATSLRRQASYGVVIGVVACGSLALVEQAPGGSAALYVSPASYAAVAVTGFMISGGAYWIGKGSLLAWRLTRPGMTQLSRANPAETPGLQSLARCYRLAFYGACFAMCVCLYPVLDWAYRIDPSPIQTLLKGTLSVAAVVLCFIIAVVPQYCLSQLVWRTRRSEIARVNDEIEQHPTEYLFAKLSVLTDSKASTVSEATVLGVVLGLGTAALPSLLKLIAGH